jgi:hypothetical protein
MASQRQRPLYIAAAAIVLVWLLAWAGYYLAKKSKMTADRVYAYQNSLDLEKMSAEERRKALQALVDKLNALSPDERDRWRFDQDWFRRLSDEEKSWFIEAFLPGEMKRALSFFERQPKEKQQKDIDDMLHDLREHAANPGRRSGGRSDDTNGPLISPELDKKVRTMGLNALYSQGSAQTKVELAPLLLEVQRQMERGILDANGY